MSPENVPTATGPQHPSTTTSVSYSSPNDSPSVVASNTNTHSHSHSHSHHHHHSSSSSTGMEPQEVASPGSTSSTASGGGTGQDHQALAHAQGQGKRPGGLAENPNARSKTVTMADGENTFGALNRHPIDSLSNSSQQQPSSSPHPFAYRVGVSEDRNKKCRRTMEDSHSFVYDYGGVRGQGYFAVFDGHAGKHAAEWCGQNFHEYFLDALIENPSTPIPDLMNKTFHTVDTRIGQLANQDGTHSGCTAVTAFLRIEEAGELKDGQQVAKGYLNPSLKSRGLMEGKGEEELEKLTSRKGGAVGSEGSASGSDVPNIQRKHSGRRLKNFVGRLTGARDSSPKDGGSAAASAATSTSDVNENEDETPDMPIADGNMQLDLMDAKSDKGLKRVLYTANVGDARAVLCRGGKAVRLTYDHKGSDAQEAKRITDAGGFVMNNRVNGVLAVTRSLGDTSMKEFVVGAPYTTETTLDEEDEFLIVACDGLWDVTEDQEAVDLIRGTSDAQEASKVLLDYAMKNYSTDNLSVMVVRFKKF